MEGVDAENAKGAKGVQELAINKGKFPVKLYEHCGVCGKAKAKTKYNMCRSCAGRRMVENRPVKLVYHPNCVDCGKEKANTPSERCHSCAVYHGNNCVPQTRYSVCGQCGKDKPRSLHPNCRACMLSARWDGKIFEMAQRIEKLNKAEQDKQLEDARKRLGLPSV